MWLVSAFDGASLVYYVAHVLTTILIDAQIVLPPVLFPEWALAVTKQFLTETNDPLIQGRSIWFLSFVYCEMILQLPFLILATGCYIYQKPWIRLPAIIYSAHTCTTLIPILAEFIVPALEADGGVDYDVTRLVLIYGVFLVFPFLIGLRWAVLEGKPFPGRVQNPVRKEKDS